MLLPKAWTKLFCGQPSRAQKACCPWQGGVRGIASEAEATCFISTKTLEEKPKGIPLLEGNTLFYQPEEQFHRYYHSVVSLGKLLRKHSSESYPLDSLLGATNCIGISVHY